VYDVPVFCWGLDAACFAETKPTFLNPMNRREMLATMGFMAAGGSLLAAPVPILKDAKSGPRIFGVREFGAAGDGITLDTASINRAIDACHAAGGGVVHLAPGTYLSGTVVLQSNVTLYLEAG